MTSRQVFPQGRKSEKSNEKVDGREQKFKPDELPAVQVSADGAVKQDVACAARAKGLTANCEVVLGDGRDAVFLAVAGKDKAVVKVLSDNSQVTVCLGDVTLKKRVRESDPKKEKEVVVDTRGDALPWRSISPEETTEAFRCFIVASLFQTNCAAGPKQDDVRKHLDKDNQIVFSLEKDIKPHGLCVLPFSTRAKLVVDAGGADDAAAAKRRKVGEQGPADITADGVVDCVVITASTQGAVEQGVQLQMGDGMFWQLREPWNTTSENSTLILVEATIPVACSGTAVYAVDGNKTRRSGKGALTLKVPMYTNAETLPKFTRLTIISSG